MLFIFVITVESQSVRPCQGTVTVHALSHFTSLINTLRREIITIQAGQCGNSSKSPKSDASPRWGKDILANSVLR